MLAIGNVQRRQYYILGIMNESSMTNFHYDTQGSASWRIVMARSHLAKRQIIFSDETAEINS